MNTDDLIPCERAAALIGIEPKRLLGYQKSELQQLRRIVDRIAVGNQDDCWPWTGPCKISLGYGRTRWDGKETTAHRAVFELVYGRIEPGLVVCHSCDNPSCVNPNHLWSGTYRDNMQDMVAKGRYRTYERTEAHLTNLSERSKQFHASNRGYQDGVKGPNAKLTEEQVLEIRASTEPQIPTAKRYGVGQWTVWAIRNRVTWRHLP